MKAVFNSLVLNYDTQSTTIATVNIDVVGWQHEDGEMDFTQAIEFSRTGQVGIFGSDSVGAVVSECEGSIKVEMSINGEVVCSKVEKKEKLLGKATSIAPAYFEDPADELC